MLHKWIVTAALLLGLGLVGGAGAAVQRDDPRQRHEGHRQAGPPGPVVVSQVWYRWARATSRWVDRDLARPRAHDVQGHRDAEPGSSRASSRRSAETKTPSPAATTRRTSRPWPSSTWRRPSETRGRSHAQSRPRPRGVRQRDRGGQGGARLRTEDRPSGKVFEQFSAVSWRSSPYRNPVIGWMNDLEHLTVDDLAAWYEQYYAPNNAILVVVGDVEPAGRVRAGRAAFRAACRHPRSSP
jgi:hypothetical protein